MNEPQEALEVVESDLEYSLEMLRLIRSYYSDRHSAYYEDDWEDESLLEEC